MSQPEEHDVDAASESGPSSASVTSDGGSVQRVFMPSTGDDRQGRTLVASEDLAVPSADGGGGVGRPGPDDQALFSAVPVDPSCRHGDAASPRGGVAGSRTRQFRKTKSAATFLLDGVAYTIGKCRSVIS